MPNWTKNIVRAKGIGELPVYSKEKNGMVNFDFNKIIPMPEELNMRDGSDTNVAIMYYLSDRFTTNDRPTVEKYIDIQKPLRRFGDKDSAVFSRDAETAKDYIRIHGMEGDKAEDLYEAGRRYVENYEEYGFPTWYGWRRAHWGTKWNACETHAGKDELYFLTAWSAPSPVIAELSGKYPDVEFVHEYLDEGSDERITERYLDGQVISRTSLAIEWGWDEE